MVQVTRNWSSKSTRSAYFPTSSDPSREALFVRWLGGNPDTTYEDFRQFRETRSAEVGANIAVCLVHQANYLLDKQIRHLEKDFVQNGGVRERMSRVRRHRRT